MLQQEAWLKDAVMSQRRRTAEGEAPHTVINAFLISLLFSQLWFRQTWRARHLVSLRLLLQRVLCRCVDALIRNIYCDCFMYLLLF